MTTCPPIHMPPTLVGVRDHCPEVFTVQCTGPVGRGPIDLMGRTIMGYEQRSLYRYASESDSSLWARVETVVKHFKDHYGWNQDVAVLFHYEVSAEQGAAWRASDDRVNLIAMLAFTAGSDKDARVRRKAKQMLSLIRPKQRRPLED